MAGDPPGPVPLEAVPVPAPMACGTCALLERIVEILNEINATLDDIAADLDRRT